MINKDFMRIEKQDIYDLVDNGVSESKTLDYKQQFPENLNDAEKKEILADVSAFSNTFWWDLIYWIKEEKWIAKEIIWFGIENIDDWKLKLESIIRTGIEPRINYEIREIKLEDWKYVIILRIKESFIKPHWISYQNNHKFYLRSSTWKYESEISELRNLFLSMDKISNKINDFKIKRITNIEINDSYITLRNWLKFIIHIVPVDVQQSIDFSDDQKLNSLFKPFLVTGWNHRFNIDWFLTYSPEKWAYTQIYRNWSIEAVRSSSYDDKKFYYAWYEEEIIEYIKKCLWNLINLWITFPCYISLCFLDIKWYILKRWDLYASEYEYLYDKNLLDTWNIVINDIDNIEKSLKPLFDVLWNAFWYKHSRNYDEKWNRIWNW